MKAADVLSICTSSGVAILALAAAAALAVGGTVGWLLSLLLMRLRILKRSFPEGEPLLDVDREHVAAEIEAAKKRGENPPTLPPKSRIRAPFQFGRSSTSSKYPNCVSRVEMIVVGIAFSD